MSRSRSFNIPNGYFQCLCFRVQACSARALQANKSGDQVLGARNSDFNLESQLRNGRIMSWGTITPSQISGSSYIKNGKWECLVVANLVYEFFVVRILCSCSSSPGSHPCKPPTNKCCFLFCNLLSLCE